MERVAWTDERIDELDRGMDAGFERIDREISELRREIGELRSLTSRVGVGIVVGLVGVIAAVFANGG